MRKRIVEVKVIPSVEGQDHANVYTGFDNGDWEDFVRINTARGDLTKEELEALADYCWEHCRDWKGTTHMDNYDFQVNDKIVAFSFRGWGGFMAVVRHLKTGQRAKEFDYMEWYA